MGRVAGSWLFCVKDEPRAGAGAHRVLSLRTSVSQNLFHDNNNCMCFYSNYLTLSNHFFIFCMYKLKVIYHPLYSMNKFVTNKSKLPQDGAQVFPYMG